MSSKQQQQRISCKFPKPHIAFLLEAGRVMHCIQMKDYGDLSYLLEAEYERQLVALSQDAELRSPPMGTRGLTKGKVSLSLWGGGGRGAGGIDVTGEMSDLISLPQTALRVGGRGWLHRLVRAQAAGVILPLGAGRGGGWRGKCLRKIERLQSLEDLKVEKRYEQYHCWQCMAVLSPGPTG